MLPDPEVFTVCAISKDMCHFLGGSKGIWVGKSITNILRLKAEGTMQLHQKGLFDALTFVAGKGVARQIEQCINVPSNKSKSLQDVLLKIELTPLLDEGDKVQYVILTFEEINHDGAPGSKDRDDAYRFQELLKVADVATAVYTGPEMTIQYANDAMVRLWGKDNSVIGKPLRLALPELESQPFHDLLHQVFITGKTYMANEDRCSLLVGGRLQDFYFNFSYKALHREDGAIYGVLNMATDVTAQVRSKEILKEKEVQLQHMINERTTELEKQKGLTAKILESSLDGIYALKAVRDHTGAVIDFEYLFANNQIAKILNLDVKDIIGTSMLQLIPENKTNGFFDLFCKLVKTGEPVKDETFFSAQGIDCWYKYVIFPLDPDTLVVSIEDVTDKKRALIQIEEQRNLLDSILKNSSNGISVSRVIRDDANEVIDARTILANEAAIKYIGLPEDVYLTKTAVEIEPNIVSSPYFQRCVQTLETGIPFLIQYPMESTGRWLEITVSKMDDDHLIHVFSDVTAVKEANLKLEKYVEDLKRSNQNLEEFAYAASHDLKEPTRKMIVFADWLKQSLGERLTEVERQYFLRMEAASARMVTLIDDLLTYSEFNQKGIYEETVDMNELINQVLGDLDLEIEQKNAKVEVGPLFILRGHRRQLQQAFHNLIGNALKYANKEVPPVVSIQCEIVRGEEMAIHLPNELVNRTFYLVSVKDNGIGFEQKEAERIFHVFTRLHGRSEYNGTGVGLSIVRKVIENHHGHIWAEGQVGVGATFYLLFPL